MISNEPTAPPPQDEDTPVRMSLDEAVAFAVQLHRGANLAQAEEIYRTVLSAEPEHVDALHFLGVLLHHTDRNAEAAAQLRKVLSLRPEYADAHNNLGNVLRAEGALEEAVAAYRRAIELAPDRCEPQNNLGVTLSKMDRVDEAIEALQKAVELEPERPDAHYNLGNALLKKGRREDAIREFYRTIEIVPTYVPAYESLGAEVYKAGRKEEAGAIYAKLVEQVPDSALGRHMLAAWTGENVPARASDQYVKELFDTFAENFDKNLRTLGYQAPSLVAEAIAQVLTPAGDLVVLDAGCGTGLCGPLVKSYARRLVGVDLSPKMLHAALARGVYDALEEVELCSFMARKEDAFDLIISADTLNYFGDLAEVFRTARLALKPEGWFVFTLEDSDREELPEGFRLQPHGRYAHSEAYVQRLLKENGFTDVRIARGTLRKERNEPVTGIIVTTRK